jgi:uncharacterized membrane protein YsdA (DUF1294 family)
MMLFGFDKVNAIKRRWRVPEIALLSGAALFGSFGALLGMFLFRHKIRKPLFFVGIPLLLIVQVVMLYAF